jgi:hypothetical protein
LHWQNNRYERGFPGNENLSKYNYVFRDRKHKDIKNIYPVKESFHQTHERLPRPQATAP